MPKKFLTPQEKKALSYEDESPPGTRAAKRAKNAAEATQDREVRAREEHKKRPRRMTSGCHP